MDPGSVLVGLSLCVRYDWSTTTKRVSSMSNSMSSPRENRRPYHLESKLATSSSVAGLTSILFPVENPTWQPQPLRVLSQPTIDRRPSVGRLPTDLDGS